MMTIFVDADGCPVKDEVFRVAARYGLPVKIVANKSQFVPDEEWIEMVVVGSKFDAADDWIAGRAGEGDIVVTTDIPLAGRVLEKGGRALSPKGRIYTEDSIGDSLATRELMSHLRDLGEITRGPEPFEDKDRSSFLQRLDDLIQAERKRQRLKGER